MGRELLVLWAGRHQRGGWEDLCEGYRRRIARLAPVRDLPVRSRSSGGEEVRRRGEGEALLAATPEPAWTVALDPSGACRSSEELARWLDDTIVSWPHPLVFYVGSDLGLSREVLQGSRERLSLGPLTLPHELARLVLYEQLYRALSIRAGIKYHRANRRGPGEVVE